MSDVSIERTCPACKISKSISEFFRNKAASFGLSTYCKPCTKTRYANGDRRRAWHAARNKEKKAAREKIGQAFANKECWTSRVFNRLYVGREKMGYIFSRFKVSSTKFYESTPCWEWQHGLNNKGYGMIQYRMKPFPVHRLVYQIIVEFVPDNLHCDHLCRNPRCVNPAHIEPVTPGENMMRGTSVQAKNAKKTHCKRGHPLSGDNLLLRRDGRECRECKRHHSREYWRRIAQRKITSPTS